MVIIKLNDSTLQDTCRYRGYHGYKIRIFCPGIIAAHHLRSFTILFINGFKERFKQSIGTVTFAERSLYMSSPVTS